MTYYQSPVVIIGGGPAGTTTSLFLSQFGIPHILVDKQHFPRHKVCGESFDGRVSHVLNALSPDYLHELVKKGLLQKSWRYSLNTEKIHLPIKFPYSNTPRLLTNRYDFDHFLLERAKQQPLAQVLEGIKIQNITQDDTSVHLEGNNISIDAQLAILATGDRSAFAGKDPKDKNAFLFARGYYQSIGNRSEEEVEIYYFKTPLRGCLILCPLPGDIYNVEIGFEKKEYLKTGLSLQAILDTYLQQIPSLQARFEKAEVVQKLKGTYMLLRKQKIKFSENKILYIGSNALSVNPVTGMGVGNAMTMAKIAAEQVKAHWNGQQFSATLAKQYEHQARKRLKEILRFNALLNYFQYKIHWIEPFLAPILKTKWSQKLLHQSDWVSQFRNPKFYWKLIRNS